MRSVQHYCQKCLAGNPLGQELCARCGTRLMLVVEPPTARYEDGGLVARHEEHLLERISALENRLMRLTDKLEQTLDLMLRQAKNAYFDHTLIDSLITILSEAGMLDAIKLNAIWRERCQRDPAEQGEIPSREPLRAQIISAYTGTEQATFEQFINAGFELLNNNDVARAIPTLEHAAALDVNNAPLHSLIGEHFFAAGKTTLARDYLERALATDTSNEKVRLLLGLTYGDAGDIEQARKLLKGSVKRQGESFAARYGLGKLFIAEQKWKDALKEFKSALAAWPSAESHYAVACVYYQLGRDRLAARHLGQAVEMDSGYNAALYLLGLTLWRLNENEQARVALSAVCEAETDEQHFRSAARRVLRVNEIPVNPKLFGLSGIAKKELITGGDQRLAQAVRRNALSAIGVEPDSN